MTFEEYQQEAKSTAIYPDVFVQAGDNRGDFASYVYPALGLCGEAGEVAEKVKKLIRDKAGSFNDEDRELIKKELGDVLWYIAAISHEFGVSLEDVAQTNISKLKSRQERNKLTGSGDNR